MIPPLMRAVWIEGPAVIDRLSIRLDSRGPSYVPSYRPPTSADWNAELHRLLGQAWPCQRCADFARNALSPLVARLDASLPDARDRHDGDPKLAQAVFAVVAHRRPSRVVETGVARGITSAAILHALEANQHGHLYSIDLPPLTPAWSSQSRRAVDSHLTERWTYIRGSTRRHLPQLLAAQGSIDLFVHDSLHTDSNMTFEFEQAWPALAPDGVLVSDDIDDNAAFENFSSRHAADAAVLVGQQTSKAISRFGILIKQCRS